MVPMGDARLSSFADPVRHAAISDILRRTSTNPTDVRDVALQGLDLSSARRVLDLGCGFGFMMEAVVRRVAPDAEIVGVDACPANERPYLDVVRAAGRRGRFVAQRIDAKLDWPDASFDLIVASFSLYFFPNILPELARVLSPDGVLLAVTHKEQSCRELQRVLDLPDSDPRATLVIRSFSAENAERLLSPWFGEIHRVEYRNSLAFGPQQQDDLLAYVRFKLPMLMPGEDAGGELPEALARAALAALSRPGGLLIDRSDAAFHCRKPKCH